MTTGNFVFICKRDLSKPVKQEVNGTVILPPLVFPGATILFPKVEDERPDSWIADDSALNGVKLYCRSADGKITGEVTSSVGKFGSWKSKFVAFGILYDNRPKVESPNGNRSAHIRH